MDMDGLMSDRAVLEEIGHRLGRRRVELQYTQADLAKEAGVSKRTVERIEAGEATNTTMLIRIMRVLELLSAFNGAIPEAGVRPMDLLRLRGKERQRVSSKKSKNSVGEDWSWGDEE